MMEGMKDRGVTRHGMKEMMPGDGKKKNDGNKHEKMHMSEEQHFDMLVKHHHKTQWVYWLIVVLGVWMLLSPLTFDYSRGAVQPTGDRTVWISLQSRTDILMWSDIICGILIIFFGLRSVKPNRPVSLWLICFIGVWLNLAPLLFWAPSSMIYLNETFVGMMLIALTVLIPGMPNMVNYMKMGPEVPPGWSYNPSSWGQRSILIALGFFGLLVSRYLAAFQMGYTDSIWDPFFGEGSRLVLHSDMSKSLFISDAGFGAFAYTFEFLMGWMGSPSRWRTMPWMVTLFGILVIPLGMVHIFLVISQPVVVGQWCTFCLLAALIMLPMIPLEVDEVVAMLQFMKKTKREGKSLWKVFWKGDTVEGGEKEDKRSPVLEEFYEKPLKVYKSSLWGMSFPWNLTVTSALGLWLMFVPYLLGDSQTAADIDHVAGALIFTFSVISMGEVIRTGRFINVLLGLLIVAAPFIFSGYVTAGLINSLVIGVLVILFSIPRGIVKEKFDTWDNMIK